MTARIALTSVFLSLLPLGLSGQQLAPAAEAERVLRARVTEFLQYHVEGNFRKAYEMIADDTKDNYFNSGKVQLKGFQINGVKFNEDFTKATVTGVVSKTMNVVGQEVPIQVPSVTTWKIENGKWVWYNEVQNVFTTPMGIPTQPAGAPAAPTDDAGLPKDVNDKTLAASLQDILQKVSVDKKEVTLSTSGPSEARIIFHNGMSGSVQLELSVPDIPGFSVKTEQSIVRGATDVPLTIRYEPGDRAGRRDPVDFQITVQPLNQTFPVRVTFAARQ